LPNSQNNAALRPDTPEPGETAELLGAQVLVLLPALRLHSVSLFDAKGNVQWLSEGALGPDEQGVVEEAIATLTTATTRAHFDARLTDSRAALFLAVRTPRAQLAGLVMVLMDAKTLSSGNLAARILTTNMRAVLQKIAIFLVPPPPLSATGSNCAISAFTHGIQALEVAVVPGSDPGATANEPEIDALALLEQPPAPAAPSGSDVLPWFTEPDHSMTTVPGAPDEVPESLRLRELIRLRSGGRTRRYQVAPVAERQRGDALTTLNLLLAWLRRNPAVLRGDPLSFTIGVSSQALADPELPAALGRALASAQLDPGTIGFELRESACVTHRLLAERFLAQCEQSRCYAVIDDFTFNTGMLDLLRSSAVKLLKVETRLVTMALRDKLAQARVVAIAQAAKVLGMHCAAKYIDSQSGRRWLAAVGFDFTQSSAVEPMQRLAEPPSI